MFVKTHSNNTINEIKNLIKTSNCAYQSDINEHYKSSLSNIAIKENDGRC